MPGPPLHPPKRTNKPAGTRLRWLSGPIHVVSRHPTTRAEQQGVFSTTRDGIIYGVLKGRKEKEREKARIANHCLGAIPASVLDSGGCPPVQTHILAMPLPEPSARHRILLANPPTLAEQKRKKNRVKS